MTRKLASPNPVWLRTLEAAYLLLAHRVPGIRHLASAGLHTVGSAYARSAAAGHYSFGRSTAARAPPGRYPGEHPGTGWPRLRCAHPVLGADADRACWAFTAG